MILHALKKSLLALGLLVSASPSDAGQVLTKLIPEPTGTANMSEWSGNPSTGISDHEITGFRSSSDGTHSYQSGNLFHPAHDGWVAKVDTFGTAVWSKSMRQIIAASPYAATITFNDPSRGFSVNDILFAAGSIYVCGESRPGGGEGWGYVARLNDAGVLVDLSMFEAANTGGRPNTSRAVALCAYVRTDGIRIGVVGDFEGTTLRVLPRMGTGMAPAMEGLVGRMDAGSRRDVFGITFVGDLGVARRGWTLGFNTANEFATAAAFDGSGDLIVAIDFDNPDAANSDLEFSNMDDSRRMFRSLTDGSYDSVPFDESSFPLSYNFADGRWCSLIKVDGATNRITAHAEPIQLESGEAGSSSHISDHL